ncbi:Alpha/Beta hydrolase protein [Lentinula raphanica]|nr:Alpha/Beta hydrolase protein [Lentinula raphanica]
MSLRFKVLPLRWLTNFSFFLGTFASPRPPKPSKTIRIPRVSSSSDDQNDNGKSQTTKNDQLILQVYYPASYQPQTQFKKRKSPSLRPVVVNFHGSGFMLGSATDDARWARSVTEYVDAVVVSVEYRLAPENPFPAALNDGVDALLWIIHHSEELGVDPHKIALSGFSAGGSLAFAVPIKLGEEMQRRRNILEGGNRQQQNPLTSKEEPSLYVDPAYRIQFIAAWYPSVDYSLTRPQRRATNARQDKNLPAWFTDLVDTSFLLGVAEEDRKLPWLSPALAPAEMLRKYIPHNVEFRLCEWDELRAEAERFSERLASDEVGRKGIGMKVIEGTTHGWDKHPRLKWDQGIEHLYKEICTEMQKTFAIHDQATM